MRHIFRSTLLLTFTALTLASCELIPDELIDIINPDDPKPEASCELICINDASQLSESINLKIDSTGADQVSLFTTFLVSGEEFTRQTMIYPKENEANILQADVEDSRGLSFREVTVDDQNRVSSIYYSYDASSPDANLASIVTTYNYDKLNIVEATAIQTDGNDVDTFKTTFEYSLTGNLMKISSDKSVISYEYGSINNKLYIFEKAYTGFDVFNPIYNSNPATISFGFPTPTPIPMPSKKLPSKQIFETNPGGFNNYTWTINSQGYPTMLEVLDQSGETRKFEYGYQNCDDKLTQ